MSMISTTPFTTRNARHVVNFGYFWINRTYWWRRYEGYLNFLEI